MTEQPKNEPENYDSSQIQKLEGLGRGTEAPRHVHWGHK